MARSSPATVRRALAGGVLLALLFGALQYAVGIPIGRAESPLDRLSVATQASGAAVLTAAEPVTGPLHVFGGPQGRLRTALIGGRAYRPTAPELGLIALGNFLLLTPLLYLGLGTVEHVRRSRAARVQATP